MESRKPKISVICHFPKESFFYPQTQEFMSPYQNQGDITVELITMEQLPPPPPPGVQPSQEDLQAMEAMLSKTYEEKFIELSEKGDTAAAMLAQTNDPPIIEKYKHLSFPIVALGYASYWAASMLTGKFSVFTPYEGFDDLYMGQLRAYGYEKQCHSIELIHYDPYDPKTDLNLDDVLIEECLEKIEQIAKEGVQAVVMGCGSPRLSFNAVEINKVSQERTKVTVLSPLVTGIEVCKALIYSRSSGLFQLNKSS